MDYLQNARVELPFSQLNEDEREDVVEIVIRLSEGVHKPKLRGSVAQQAEERKRYKALKEKVDKELEMFEFFTLPANVTSSAKRLVGKAHVQVGQVR